MTENARVLKSGDTFAVFDPLGDIDSSSSPGLGLYHQDTRFCSQAKLRVEGGELALRGSAVDDNGVFAIELISAQSRRTGASPAALQISRRKFLNRSTCYERLRFRNSSGAPIDFTFSFEFDADFADLFEVRGVKRRRRGNRFPPKIKKGALELAYEGLDKQLRASSALFRPTPATLDEGLANYKVHLTAGGEATYDIMIYCQSADGILPDYDKAAGRLARELQGAKARHPTFSSPNADFDRWVNRSLADLDLMWTETPHGPYPYAGLPWYNTAFGRDGIITAFETLWFNPAIARGVLSYLAATQATSTDPTRDAEPGKILHETRNGEMAVLGEVPFGKYYGSIDATPLFVFLAGAYHDRTGDLNLIRSIWPNIEAALRWIGELGDPDGDGFFEYAGASSNGLRNQGWKDSDGSIFHADGTIAEGPVALCEVQAYVYAAQIAAARLGRVLGKDSFAQRLEDRSESLRRRFEETFWCEDISTYALALDRRKRLCRVRSSNAGHCLFAGIANEERAGRVAEQLMSEKSFSGWGIRTIAANEVRYDPRSYHNGSIWPHDNAIIAAGFARYGFREEAAKIFAGLFRASGFFEFYRLPELFCGFAERNDQGPVSYPVSCSPQTWASCAVFLLLEACLEINVDVNRTAIAVSNRHLPKFLAELEINRIPIGDSFLDLRVVTES